VIRYRRDAPLANDALNELFASAWDDHAPRDFAPILARCAVHVAAFDDARLVGFVHVAWDGGLHGFVLDTSVDRAYQRRGIGSELLRNAVAAARERGLVWLHVDFEARLERFYRAAGFAPTAAGLLRL
jgi:ribosomal protein S18 acetylase RimI-like enzyme